jgi:hypothetical protein
VLGRTLTAVGAATGVEMDPVPLVRSEPEWLFDPSVTQGVLGLAVSNVDRYEYEFDPNLEVITDWAAFSGSTIAVRSTLRHFDDARLTARPTLDLSLSSFQSAAVGGPTGPDCAQGTTRQSVVEDFGSGRMRVLCYRVRTRSLTIQPLGSPSFLTLAIADVSRERHHRVRG